MSDSTSSSGNGGLRKLVLPVLLLVVAVLAVIVWRQQQLLSPGADEEPTASTRVVFVTADQTRYWEGVIEGAMAAANVYDIDLQFVQPTGDTTDQNERLTEKMSKGEVDGVVISPVDAVRQAEMLRELGSKVTLVTVDSDSPDSERMCFVGADNYEAGLRCGQMVRGLMPEGGRVLIVCGPLDKANGRERRQGLIDALLQRGIRDVEPIDPVEGELSGGGFVIAGTLLDQIDPEQATAQIVEALERGEQYDCIVGLYGYHAMSIADALGENAGGVKVVGFDALPRTLGAMKNGRVHGIIAQDQFSYGYHSVRVVVETARGGVARAIPHDRRIIFPPVGVTQETVDEFIARSGPGAGPLTEPVESGSG